MNLDRFLGVVAPALAVGVFLVITMAHPSEAAVLSVLNGVVVVGLVVFGIGLVACLIAGTCLAVGRRSNDGR